MSFYFKLFLLLHLKSYINTLGDTIIRNNGESVHLVCKLNTSLTQQHIRWLFYSLLNVEKEIYDSLNSRTNENYDISCATGQPYCNITVHNVSEDGAGRYKCIVAEFHRDDPKPMKIFDLIVGELKCSSMIVEKESCKHKLKNTCTAKFFGKLEGKSQPFGWYEVDRNGTFIYEEYENIPRNNFKMEHTFKIEKIVYIDEAVNNKYGCRFEVLSQIHPVLCDNNQERFYSIRQEDFFIYMEGDKPYNVACNVNINISENINCSFLWKHRNGDKIIEINNQVLTVDMMDQFGLYICYATCQKCQFKVLTVEVTRWSRVKGYPELDQSYYYIGFWIAIMLLVILTIIILGVGLKYYKKKPSRNDGRITDQELSVLRNQVYTIVGSGN